jgi:hypothetical protein
MSNEQTIKDLRTTADVIDRNGLTKDALFDRVAGKEPPECPVCSLGGINVTVWGHPGGPGPEYKADQDEWRSQMDRDVNAERALSAYLGLGEFGSIPAWNDQPERTQAEVVEAFRAAADALEGVSK